MTHRLRADGVRCHDAEFIEEGFFANMWEMPLRVLAFSQLVALIGPISRTRIILLIALVAGICAMELRQYIILAVDYPLYELVSEGLLRALNILKSAPPH